MKYKIDVARIRENSIVLNGWVIGSSPEAKAEFKVQDENQKDVEFKYVPVRRDDVSQNYFKTVYEKDFGFDIRIPYVRDENEDRFLIIRCDGKTSKVKLNTEIIEKHNSSAHKKHAKLKSMMNKETFHSAIEFWRENGLKAFLLKSSHKLQGIDSDYDYPEWYQLTKTSDEELEAQKSVEFDYMPKLSVVIPAYKTPERYLAAMLDSLRAQTYKNWEVCVADGSPRGESAERVLKRYALRMRESATLFSERIRGLRATPTLPSIWPRAILSFWPIMTTRWRRMHCLSV